MGVLPGYTREELAFILCYPVPTMGCLNKRVVEASLLRVRRFLRQGKTLINSIPVIGKGTTAIVIAAEHVGGVLAALKVRRLDSNRPSMLREAYILRLANTVGVGPPFLAASKNLLLWRLVRGVSLLEWLKGKEDPEKVKKLFAQLLYQLYLLDKTGIVHTELSRPSGHILVENDKPVVLDFESASLLSKKSNVTQFLSLLLKDTEYSVLLRSYIPELPDKGKLRELLRQYKRERNLVHLLKELKLIDYLTTSITT